MSQIRIKQIKELSGSTPANNGDYLAWDSTLGEFTPQAQPIDGAKGDQGDPGPQGLQGATGAIGPDGPQGDPGPDGAKGAKGDIGPDGPQGIQGITGAKGAKGDIGPDGPQGPQGIDGDHWTSQPGSPTAPGINVGDQFLDTDDGTVFEWDGGAWNPTGNIQGPQGPQGIQGITGATGPDGPQGLQGATGPDGPQGIQGITGPDGPQGPQGIQGITGAKGDQGDPGPTGPTGTGFTTVANPAIHRILTSDGTPDGAIAEDLFRYDSVHKNFETGNINSAFWALDDSITWESHIFNGSVMFDAGGNYGNYGPPQAALLIDENVMVEDTIMAGDPRVMVWDPVNKGVGYQVSSKQFKENIVDLEFDHDLLFNEVRGVKYNGIGSNRVQVGFIAEEVENFDPAVVLHDEEGKPFSLDYGKMVPVLFEVIRDLRSRIEKLEQK